MRWMNRISATACLFLLLIGNVFANSVLEEIIYTSLRAEGMGGARIASGIHVQDALGNPATLAQREGTSIEISGRQASYDPSGALGGKTSDTGWTPRALNVAHPLPVFSFPVSLAFGVNRPESRETPYLGDVLEVGSLLSFYGAVGIDLASGIRFGASATHMFVDYNLRITSPFDDNFVVKTSMRSTSTRFGFLFDVNELGGQPPIKLGVTIRPAYRVKMGPNSSANVTHSEQPWIFGAGAAWSPNSGLEIALDAEYHQIGGTRNDPSSSLYNYISDANRDLVVFRLGFEKRFPYPDGEVALRAGARSYPTLRSDESELLGMGQAVAGFGFTMGFGVRHKRAEIDFSWVIKDQWEASYYSPNVGEPGGMYTDFGASYQSISIGVTYHFKAVQFENTVWYPKQPQKEEAVD